MGEIADWLTVLVAAAALALSVGVARRQTRLEESSYLSLRLALTRLGPASLLASTSLENRSADPKTLETVFLLLGPIDEDPTQTFNAVLSAHGQPPVRDISEFGRATRGLDPHCRAEDRQYIRLDYYTVENSEVGDECLTYEAVLDISSLSQASTYAIRLFLYGPARLHRVVQRALMV
jgi:hypothetical protein